MDEILLFIVLGLGSGALIAGISLGVVLTYRGSGIINLSVGAMAMLGGYAFWALTSGKIASLPTGAALPLALLFVVACGALVEFAVFRPLRNSSPLSKMVSSLGVLLIAQSAMLLAFGTTPQPEPTILPTTGFMLFGSNIGWDIIILAVLIVVITAALWAVYKWTRFGLATRAASENEAAAMLGGLNPVRIGLANNLLSSLLAGLLGILAAAITQLDPSTLPLQIIPALAAALIAGFTSFWTATISAFVISIVYSLIDYMAAQTWFPQSGGVALPGTTDLLAFLIIIGVLFWRGTRIPGRGELVERRMPEAPRPQHLWRTALICAVFGAILLIVFPFDFRQALINTLIGAVMALSLVVITGYVGQISVIQLSLAGAAGFTVSHMAVNFGITFPARRPGSASRSPWSSASSPPISAVRVRGVSLAVVTLAGAVAIENFGFTNTTWGGGSTGSPVPEPKFFGLDLGSQNGFHGIDGNVPSPVFGWRLPGLLHPARRLGRVHPARQARPADARHPLQRARRVRRRDQPAHGEAVRVQHRRVHRRRRRRAVRLRLRLGQPGPLRPDHRPVADRVRLRRRHHADLRRRLRGPDLGPGAVPVRAAGLVRPVRQLVPAVRRRRPDLHPAAEPDRRRRRHLPQAPQEGAGARAGRGRGEQGADHPAHRAPGPVRQSGCPRGRRPVRPLRRRPRPVRRDAER